MSVVGLRVGSVHALRLRRASRRTDLSFHDVIAGRPITVARGGPHNALYGTFSHVLLVVLNVLVDETGPDLQGGGLGNQRLSQAACRSVTGASSGQPCIGIGL